jgi:hypothetical protein
MAKSKKTTRRKTIKLWTAQDLKILKQMARQKSLGRVIAKKLGRTLKAVHMKASKEGVSLKK